MKGKTIALIRHTAALEEDCRSADIVIAPFSVGKGCNAARVVIDRRALKAEGACALYIEGLSIRSESVAETRGRRPWVPEREAAKAAPKAEIAPHRILRRCMEFSLRQSGMDHRPKK